MPRHVDLNGLKGLGTTLLGSTRITFAPQAVRSWTFTGRAGIGRLFEGIMPFPQVVRPQGDSLATVGFSGQVRAA